MRHSELKSSFAARRTPTKPSASIYRAYISGRRGEQVSYTSYYIVDNTGGCDNIELWSDLIERSRITPGNYAQKLRDLRGWKAKLTLSSDIFHHTRFSKR